MIDRKTGLTDQSEVNWLRNERGRFQKVSNREFS